MSTLQDRVRQHSPTINLILEFLQTNRVDEEAGEFAMLWLAGLSMGTRQIPLIGHESEMIEVLAAAWQFAAAHLED